MLKVLGLATALCVATLVLSARAEAGTLTRFIGINHSGNCVSFGLQEAGHHAIAWYGPFRTSIWDHVNASALSSQPKYYLEWTVEDCASHKVLYRDFTIFRPAGIHKFFIESIHERYVLVNA